MSLTKKDLESLAAVVKSARENGSIAYSGSPDTSVAFMLADWAASTNPRFDRDKFLKACGVTD